MLVSASTKMSSRRVAADDRRASADDAQLLHRDHVVALARLAVVGLAVDRDRHVVVGAAVVVGVDVGDRVEAGAAVDHVGRVGLGLLLAGADRVVAALAADDVRALEGLHGVVAVAAVQLVRAVAADDRVVARPALDVGLRLRYVADVGRRLQRVVAGVAVRLAVQRRQAVGDQVMVIVSLPPLP